MPTGSKSPTSALTREVAGLLRARLAHKNISQVALAATTGISTSQLSKMLRGVKPIDLDQLDEICWALGLEVRDIVQSADEATDSRFSDFRSEPLVDE